MADKGWRRTVDDPLPLPDGRALRTPRDAGQYIAKLPKREHDAEKWQVAIRALVLVAEYVGDTMLPRMGTIRALHRETPSPEPRPRKKRARKVVP